MYPVRSNQVNPTAKGTRRLLKPFLFAATILATICLIVLGSLQTASAAINLYPNLKTLPPRDLKFDTATINGSRHYVLRFSNIIWNAGEGTMELRGETVSNSRTKVYQRIYDDAGNFSEVLVGDFIFHPSHNHWHFEDFAEYELWTRAEYDAWIASGRQVGQAQRRGSKTTFCLMDTGKVQNLPGSPSKAQYTLCGQELQGISVGWGDMYAYSLPEQWIDLGNQTLPGGNYVLRSIADPKNILIESNDRDASREGAQANEATTFFSVKGKKIRITP